MPDSRPAREADLSQRKVVHNMRVEFVVAALLTAPLTSVSAQCPPDWTQEPVTGPSIRAYPGMVFDENASRVLLYGGSRSSTYYRDLWQWDGAAWSLLDSGAGTSPGVRNAVAIAYDASQQRTYLFGGGGTSATDTWQWDGADWSQAATVGPTWRGFGGMCYVSSQQHCVLFGGWAAGFNYLNDTWIWDGAAATWTQASPAGTLPHERGFHAMAYDAGRDRVVLYGGLWNTAGGSNYLFDTWEWDGVAWTERTPAHNPGPRAYHTMTYDPIGRRVLLFAGFDFSSAYFNDVWQWDGNDWTELPYGATAPLGRQAHGAAFDQANGELVIFGGARGGAYRNDTWTAVLPASARIETNPIDVTACPGASASFTIVAGGEPALTYQWQSDDATIPGLGPWIDLADGVSSSGAIISGATTDSLMISNITAAEATAYRCAVTNPCDTATSAAAQLSLCANCPGDLDGNGLVDLVDLATLLAHFGTASGATPAHGDSDADGDVDLSDLTALLAAFGSNCN